MDMIQQLQDVLHKRTTERIIAEANRILTFFKSSQFLNHRLSPAYQALQATFKDLRINFFLHNIRVSLDEEVLNRESHYYQDILAEETQKFVSELAQFKDLLTATEELLSTTEELSSRVDEVEGAVQ